MLFSINIAPFLFPLPLPLFIVYVSTHGKTENSFIYDSSQKKDGIQERGKKERRKKNLLTTIRCICMTVRVGFGQAYARARTADTGTSMVSTGPNTCNNGPFSCLYFLFVFFCFFKTDM